MYDEDGNAVGKLALQLGSVKETLDAYYKKGEADIKRFVEGVLPCDPNSENLDAARLKERRAVLRIVFQINARSTFKVLADTPPLLQDDPDREIVMAMARGRWAALLKSEKGAGKLLIADGGFLNYKVAISKLAGAYHGSDNQRADLKYLQECIRAVFERATIIHMNKVSPPYVVPVEDLLRLLPEREELPVYGNTPKLDQI